MMSSTSPPPARRLSARRGSVSASDPFGKHAELNSNPSRSSSSTLTIVRVLPAQQSPSLQEPPPNRRFRRPASNNPEPPSPRLSFAFSSFAKDHSNNAGQQPPSPSSSPRLRPSSPTHRKSFSGGGKPRLSAEQVYDLAKQSTNPRLFPITTSPGETCRPQSACPPPTTTTTTTPATFTPLPDDIYLPFIDRPAEVASLISTPPSAKLFALLQQTFSKNRQPHDGSELPRNPTEWSYSQLYDWLTTTPRETVPDPLWVLKARKCILSHSELIWERIKGALGVPPELEIDTDIDAYEDYFNRINVQATSLDDDDEAPKTDDLEDAGRKARGHWDDWDAIIDSPVSERQHVFGTDYGVAIEPLVATGTSLNPPPLNANEAVGLGDIAEGAEEEEEETSTATTATETPTEQHKDEAIVDPSQIHGIKISTSPVPAPVSFSPARGMSPVSLYASLPRTTTESVGSVSRSASFSSVDDRPALRRPSFAGSVKSMSDIRYPKTFHAYDSDGSEAGYDPVGDRSPGNPLFPSNFARLALGPTLAANNPSLRSPGPPPPPRYVFQRSNSTSSLYRLRSNSNNHEASRSRFSRSDYAVTVASEGSVHEDQKA